MSEVVRVSTTGREACEPGEPPSALHLEGGTRSNATPHLYDVSLRLGACMTDVQHRRAIIRTRLPVPRRQATSQTVHVG